MAVEPGVLELKYDPYHFEADPGHNNDGNTLKPWTPSILKRSTQSRGVKSTSFLGRATEAASSIVVTRDDEGRRRLNTGYLLRVMTVATAHVADRPYWRRSVSEPFSDFGSTVGNDAGLNILHAFQPGLLQLVKTHEPRFVTRIEQRVHQK